MDKVDCLVIGAGVVGLACARALAQAGHDVIVIEQNSGIGEETSSRNSEVIHSGIYYPEGSLKASACVRGRDALYDFCDSHHIPYKKCGKLIVATSHAEKAEIRTLIKKGHTNGVDDLELISGRKAMEMEPDISCLDALWSPSTGIIDSHAFMLALQGDLEDCGGMIAFETPLEGGEITDDSITLQTGGKAPMKLSARLVINAAGLSAQSVAYSLESFASEMIPARHLAKGVYFSLSGRSPFTHLIYPAPEAGGLGVHATLDMGGQCRFGPDVEWVDCIDYDVDPSRGDSFYQKIRRYWPGLQDGQLHPAYSGIRPKISAQGEPAGDFMIQGPAEHKSGPIINLFGIESPGLTSALALAEDVSKLARTIMA